MKKFLIYITILSLLFCVVVPHQQLVYATTTEEDNSILDYVEDVIYKTADCVGAVLDFTDDIRSAFYEYISKTVGKDYTEWLKNRMNLNKDGSITLSEDLYKILLEFIEENATQKINISDYIYKYYPDKEISTSRVPVANASYDYIMNITGDEGKSVVDTLTVCKYYWMAFETYEDKIVAENGKTVGGARYVYISPENENNVIFIKTCNNTMQPFFYDAKYQTFANVPVNYINYYLTGENANSYEYNDSYTGYSSTNLDGSMYYYYDWIRGNRYFMCLGSSSSDYPTTGQPFNYYGTVRFPVWVSQEKYVEYMTLFPNYDQNQYITTNEDNSVTINNFYKGDDTPDIDYSNTLEEIRGQISGLLSSFNIFTHNLHAEIQEELDWLEKIYKRQWDLYEILEKIYNKIQSGSSADLGEVIDYLKKINNKLLYSNVVETADAIADWLDLLFNDEDDKDATDKAKKALSAAMETAFPFSIICSYEALLVLLEAEPVAPIFEIPVDMKFINYKGTITIDLQQFDTAIGVLKWFLLIIYIWALILLTVKFFNIGGENS